MRERTFRGCRISPLLNCTILFSNFLLHAIPDEFVSYMRCPVSSCAHVATFSRISIEFNFMHTDGDRHECSGFYPKFMYNREKRWKRKKHFLRVHSTTNTHAILLFLFGYFLSVLTSILQPFLLASSVEGKNKNTISVLFESENWQYFSPHSYMCIRLRLRTFEFNCDIIIAQILTPSSTRRRNFVCVGRW